ncbi:MAG TPA: cysteine dioxygenase family protein [Solirubrobacteraceae bacterium]|jgi:predicted metal-dependent enzyme (double-stranded beta helix superfamily)|nr:cysteine dioxygenase family protein [Solirubrobacteraceae bacterium]
MQLKSLPPRNLDCTELEQLVNRLAREPDIWHEHVEFPGDRRQFVSLYRDNYVDVWVLCWTPESDTGFHDHDISSGAVHVVDGTLCEATPRMGGEPSVRLAPAGSTFSFGPEHIHRLSGEESRSVSIHAYSPPLWRLGQYSIDLDGVMRRVPVSYADELRPLDAPVAA